MINDNMQEVLFLGAKLCGLLLVVALLCTRPAMAETVLLTRGDDTFGLGWLFLDSTGKCRVATPRHVIETSDGSLTAPDLLDSFNRIHATHSPVSVSDPDIDLAFISVGGLLAREGCSRDRIRATPLQSVIDGMKQADLGIATPAERQTIPVAPRALSRDDAGGSFIAFAAVDPQTGFQKGMSGGTVTYNGRPIAMLFEVDTENGVGIALRYDVIAAQFQKLAASPEKPVALGSTAKGDLVVERGRLVRQDAGLSSYLAGDSPLELAPEPDRIVLTYSMIRGSVVRGVNLKGTGLPESGALIVEVENAGGGFLPGARCLLSVDLSCGMSPRRADRLRLTLTGKPSDHFTIRELNVF